MDSDLHFSNDKKAHDGLSRHENHDNHTQSQSTPFLQTDGIASRSRHTSISNGNSPEKEGNVPVIHGWPDTASRLKKRTAWTYLSLLWAVVVTFLPAIFLRKSRSERSESQAHILMGLAWLTIQHERY